MIALEPGEECCVWLDRYKDVPIESRPVFLFRAKSMREQRDFDRRFNELWKVQTADEQTDAIRDFFLSAVYSARNQRDGFDLNDVESCMTRSAMLDVIRAIIHSVNVQPEEKKS